MTGIYIHWPFCARKCSYCSFVSTSDTSFEEAYLHALEIEIDGVAAKYPGIVDSVFFGGGTPSFATAPTIPRILCALRRAFPFAEDVEISMEANPSSITEEKLNSWLDAGVNRLSIGLQSAREEELYLLGRLHDLSGFRHAYDAARLAGFDNINIDIIYGLPGQTRKESIANIEYVVSASPEHISAYALSIEPGTPLGRLVRSGMMEAPDEDIQASMYEDLHDMLTRAGYDHYEISNFARADRRCRHNLRYWTGEDYLGLGCAAHSKIGKMRFCNTDSLQGYIDAKRLSPTAYADEIALSSKDMEEEYLMLQTRLADGISFRDYEHRFRHSFQDVRCKGIAKNLEEGLLRIAGDTITPTLKGFLFQNRLARQLMFEDEQT